MRDGILQRGRFIYQVWEFNQIIRQGYGPNGVTLPARNDIYDKYFRNGVTSAAWYLGLIRDDNFTGLSEADTMASHAGWEEGTEYTEATRVAWSPDATSGGVITNSVAAEFSVNAEQIFKGGLLVDESTKGGSTGVLWATGLFDGDQALKPGQTFKLYYELEGLAA